MLRHLSAALALCLLSACASAPDKAVTLALPAVAPGNLSQGTLREVTQDLSSDAFEGRAPGTPAEAKTLAYLSDRFKQAGLQPGNKGKWFQDVPLVEITAANYDPLVIGEGANAQRLDFGTDWAGVSYRTDKRIDLRHSQLVFVGYGIVAPEKGWNDYAGIDMRGKTAIILVNDPDWQNADLKGPFNGRAMTYYGRWTYKFEEAARQGAAAALIVHDTIPAAYGWNVVENGWSGAQAYAASDSVTPKTLINGWLQKDAAQRIITASGHDFERLGMAARKRGFRPVPLGIAATTGFDNAIRRYTSSNVIGILPGTQRPHEVVLHAAHWDHLGRCPPAEDGDDICNGAIDNATGTAALIALAQAHAQAGPTARSLVFMALTAEESGLLGSAHYAANPVFPLADTVGGVNIDALSMAGPAKDVILVGAGKSDLDAYLAHALAQEGRRAAPETTPEKGYYYRSDHFSFAKKGVPMLYFDGGEDLVHGGRAAGAAWAANYTANRYHTPKDEFDPAWDWSGAMADLQIYYRVGRMMAESANWPNWRKGDEFRGARDATCSPAGGC